MNVYLKIIVSVLLIGCISDKILSKDSTQQTRACNCPCNSEMDANQLNQSMAEGMVQIGVDNANNPIEISYIKKGIEAPGKPTLICVDPYLGKTGYKCLMDELSPCCVVYAFDAVGSGQSSANAPTDLDGVAGEVGYSFNQFAVFLHNFIVAMDIQPPIVYVAVDTHAPVGLKYCVRYADDPKALSKFVIINSSPSSVVSDDPCKLSFLTTTQAEFISSLFATDPCTAMCALLRTSFNEPACFEAATKLYNQVVNYTAAQDPAIFSRILLNTYPEDTTALLSQITIPTLCLFSVADNTDLLSRKAQGLVFFGYCPRCTNPEQCSAAPEILPIVDCRFYTLLNKGTLAHRTDHKEVERYIRRFVFDCDRECCVCQNNPHIPVICSTCP